MPLRPMNGVRRKQYYSPCEKEQIRCHKMLWAVFQLQALFTVLLFDAQMNAFTGKKLLQFEKGILLQCDVGKCHFLLYCISSTKSNQNF